MVSNNDKIGIRVTVSKDPATKKHSYEYYSYDKIKREFKKLLDVNS